MTLLVHAIARRRCAEPPAGLRGSPLEWIAAGELGLWATPLPEGTAEMDRDDALDHHRIVEALADREACLPVRFATRVADATRAGALIVGREAELSSALVRVAGRREIAVTLVWPDAAVIPGRGHRVEGGGPGTAYLAARQHEHAADGARRKTAEDLARRLEGDLAVEQGDVWHVMCPSDRIALSSSILARPGEDESLKARAIEVVSGYEGVRAVVSGPWPPYSFVGAR